MKWRASIIILVVMLFVVACGHDPIPKPRGYFRIDMPPHAYQRFDTTFPFTFECPVSAEIITRVPGAQKYWFNLHYPAFDGTVYFSYKPVKNNLMKLINDSHEFVGKHMAKASAVDERVILDRETRRFGLIFEIVGAETASPYQFFITDSTNHFLRGALYFYNAPNNDSLAPVIDYVKKDLEHLITTFQWEE